MDWELGSLFQAFGLGIAAGFVLYVIFSLLGYGIYRALKMLNH